VERAVTKALNSTRRATVELLEGQAPIALIGLLAIAVIVAIHWFARPHIGAVERRMLEQGCTDCGTVVAVRRSAHSTPATFVEVQMADGSLRTVRAPDREFSVGDTVELKNGGLTLRGVF
jgi:hypothetical protein